IILMYRRDAVTVGALWASFLGLLRGAVYVILAAVFLLPARQNYDTHETRSRVVVLWDVSPSMDTKDDLPGPGQSLEKIPSRQATAVTFLTRKFKTLNHPDKEMTFLEHLQAENPVYCYRFGLGVDEDHLLFADGKKFDPEGMTDWLHPDLKRMTVPQDRSKED